MEPVAICSAFVGTVCQQQYCCLSEITVQNYRGVGNQMDSVIVDLSLRINYL